MSNYITDKPRKIIPRWRSFANTVLSGEILPRPVGNDIKDDSEMILDSELSTWYKHKGLFESSSILGLSLIINKDQETREVAKYVLRHKKRVSPVTRQFAETVLHPQVKDFKNIDYSFDPSSERNRSRTQIHRLRKRLMEEPRNAILWVDLSLAYSILGLNSKASRAMQIAVNLYPNNRYIVRSASRLFVHLGEPDKALSILTDSDSLKFDPWQLASEISISDILKKTSNNVKVSRRLLESLLPHPYQTTELASALATLEMTRGDFKKSKKLFKQALLLPNENTLAQARWAAKNVLNTELRLDYINTPRSFEAKAWNDIFEGNIDSAIQNSINWLLDQPFSKRPAEVSSSLLSTNGEYDKCINITKFGLEIDPKNPTLLNNLAFAYACSNKIQEAKKAYSLINKEDLSHPLEVCWLATNGLIFFRSGLVDKGNELYLNSINLARKYGLPSLEERAKLYLSREEFLSGLPSAKETFAEVESTGYNDVENEALKNRISKLHRMGFLGKWVTKISRLIKQ